MDIQKKLSGVPASAGIYILKGPGHRVLYVGKAKNLRNRLRTYFQGGASLDARKSKMVTEVEDFEYIVTENELEALVLEANFIKRSRPRYNIILRDDKNYPYLKLTVNEEWPGIEVVRKIKKDGALYFGPYVPAGAMWEMMRFIRRNFPIRQCRYNLQKPFRPCVRCQMGRCLAPCSASRRSPADRERYMRTVNDVKSFITGEKKELLSGLRSRMQQLSDEQRFEEAAAVRDSLFAIEKAWESQRVTAPELGDMDVIGLYREGGDASVFILFIRNGAVIGRKDFFLRRLGDMPDKEIVAGFMEQFYLKEMLVPPKIITPVRARLATQRQWLSRKRGGPVRVGPAKSSEEEKVLNMAGENAFYSFMKHRDAGMDETLHEVKRLLGLATVPEKISAVDVSNISGSEAVGAVVVYEKGKFRKEGYRLFRVRTVDGINDFAMMGEVVGRYLKGFREGGGSPPQLILVDGGRGQLESALKVLKDSGLAADIAAIAKARDAGPDRGGMIRRDVDRVYLPGRTGPVYLEPFLASTHLLQKIRDEAHRFAVSYHKRLRTKRTLESPLEKIKGIGKKRRLLLLRRFGSIDAIRKASIEDIASLKGMNKKIAGDLKEALRQTPETFYPRRRTRMPSLTELPG